MKRNLILTIALIFVCLSHISSQCNDPAAPGTSCQAAISFCNNELDGYCSSTYNSGVGTPVSMPPFCGSVQNNLWIEFVAGTTSISLEFTIDNCLNGDGLQAMILHSDDCVNFTGVTNCYTASTSGGGSGTNIFTLDGSNYVIGETYYVMIDGWLGDYCDFSIDVISGSTQVPALSAPDLPSGLSTVCPGANSITYSIPAVSYATGYNWSVPAGSTYTQSLDGTSITVNFSPGVSSGSICVEAFNDCELGSQTCLPLTIQNLPPAYDYGEYCAGSTFLYPENGINYTEGSYVLTLPGASYLGCDSTVILEVTENPIQETFLIETICEGESVEVGGVPYSQTNSSIMMTLSTWQGCDSIVNLDLTVLDPESVLLVTDEIDCNNQDVFINGAASTAHTYQWSTSNGNIISGQGTPLITVDQGGTYTLTTTMSQLGVTCTNTSSVFVNENFAVPTVSLSTNDLNCANAADGSASVSVSGGVAPYTYNWSNGAMTSSVSNLTPGSYEVTVTGDNGCETTESFTISEPNSISFNINVANVSCNGAGDGSAFINASGGTAPYSYLWNTGLTTGNVSNLIPGNYELTITDANGCTVTESFEITEPDPIQLSITPDQPLCAGDDGTATVTASGGAGSFSYLWSGTPVQTTATATGLSNGTYNVTVTDNNNCSEVISVDINAPSPIQISTSAADPSCYGANDGFASITASGGTGSLSYSWNTIPAQQTPAVNNLEAGTYEVVVTDQNNCTGVAYVDLLEPDELSITFDTQDVLCFGGETGLVEAQVTGGTAPYIYNWNDPDNQNTATAINLPAGDFEVTVTDANNCQTVSTASLLEPVSELNIVSSTTPALCGTTTGTIDLSISGGSAPYTFSWTNGIPSVEDPTGLGAGTYSVIVTDANACTASSNVTINTPTGLEALVSVTNVTCYGTSDGVMDITVNGGSGPYTFEWSEPSNNGNEDFVNIPAAEYTVTVTDNDGCTVVATALVEEPTELAGTITPSPASCGGADGSIDLDIVGGVGSYNYDWNYSAYDGLQNLTGLTPGTYSVVVTDQNGCSIDLSSDIIVPNGPVINLVSTDATCNGQNSGALDLSVSGGTAPYSYAWNNGLSNLEDHINVFAGSYTVTVTDQNNCSAVANAIIDQPQPILLTTGFTNLTCNGSNDGSALVTASGGLAPYTYNWSNGQTGTDVSDLEAGLIVVTITDASGCQAYKSFNIAEPAPIQALYTVSNPSCVGNTDGAINLDVTGGDGLYNYIWSAGLPSIEDQSGINQGTYAVTITDGSGCSTEIFNITLNDPDPVLISYSTTLASCNTADGTINLNVFGGAGGYTYQWSNGVAPVEDPDGLIEGIYEVTVTDLAGCTSTEIIEVDSPSDLSTIATTNNVQCANGTDGSIDLTVTGGAAPFSFVWDNTAQQIEDPTNLMAGSYSVTVTDANNCTSVANASVQEPAEINIQLSATDATCGDANGAINASISGGTGGYIYEWSNGAINQNPSNLLPGTYDLTVTDANACSVVETIEVQTPAPIEVDAVTIDAICFGDNSGSIELTISGGTAPFSFNWDNGLGTVQNPSGLTAGEYIVTITDDIGCTLEYTTNVYEPEILASTAVVGLESCGSSNGSIDITITGGTPPYNYNWQDGIGNMEDPDNLSAGSYSVTVSDANSCQYITVVEVFEAPPFFINAVTTEPLCNGEDSGAINLNVEGGVAPYSFEWSNGELTEDLFDLSAGVYEVTVTDDAGCTITYQSEIEEPQLLEIFSIDPINVSCNGFSDGGIVLEVIGGTPLYMFDWNVDSLDGIQSPNDLGAGIYDVIVTDSNGCVTTTSINIEEPLAISIDANVGLLSCFGDSIGSIDLAVSGGTMPFSYDWNQGIFDTQDLSNLPAGQYEVYITDANNCLDTALFILDQPDPVVAIIENISDYSGYNISCPGENDGFIEISANGGVAPYVFEWENGFVSSQLNDVGQGVYNVVVTDANGCEIEEQYGLTAPPLITSEIELIDPTCYDDNDGQIVISETSGGIAPYLYALDQSYFSGSNAFNQLTAGNYQVIIQDANGCEWISELQLINPNELVVDLGDDLLIQLGDSVQLDPIMNIDILELDTFVWQSRLIDELYPWVTPTESTVYSIQVVSEDGCIAEDEIQLRVKKDRQVYVPNIFTPNNDGVNDIFFPQFGKGIQQVNSFQVFDRWGELIYLQSEFLPGNNTVGWDGTLRGQPLNNAVFIYFIEVTFVDGRVEKYSGDFTLFK